MKAYTLTLLPEAKKLTISEDTLLADALVDAGVPLPMPCGGKGICRKCKVKVEGRLSEKTDLETKGLHDQPGYRLACQTRLAGNARIHVQEKPPVTIAPYPSLDAYADYGLAVDIGTTTIQVSLVDLLRHKSYLLDSFLNPQRRYGHDVISRIAAAQEPHIFQDLIRVIRKRIYSSMAHGLRAVGLPLQGVRQLIFSGNTTMLHLFFGLDVSSMGIYPYTAQCLDFNGFDPEDIDCHDSFPDVHVLALPAATTFLGSDFIGGLALCYTMGFRRNTFFIDMGTNGELFLINPAGQIEAASCAMGPALEGMNISCGMTADTGAITHISTHQNTLEYEMIPPGPPLGMTGTALIDLLCILLQAGHVTTRGAFHDGIHARDLHEPLRYMPTASMKKLTLWGDLVLTQSDIRSVQLAKGASLAAARILLKETECLPEEIEHVIVAGGLGQHIVLENFCRLNFIPDFPSARYHFLGNTSLKAAERACLDKGFLSEAYRLRDRIREIDLARHPDFEREFITALNF